MRVIILVANDHKKDVGSTEGMQKSLEGEAGSPFPKTSPLLTIEFNNREGVGKESEYHCPAKNEENWSCDHGGFHYNHDLPSSRLFNSFFDYRKILMNSHALQWKIGTVRYCQYFSSLTCNFLQISDDFHHVCAITEPPLYYMNATSKYVCISFRIFVFLTLLFLHLQVWLFEWSTRWMKERKWGLLRTRLMLVRMA